MKVESINKLTAGGNAIEETNQTVIDSLMASMPVTEIVSSLNDGDTILQIFGYTAVTPVIGGNPARNKSIVIEAETRDKNGEVKRRPLYLSTFIRKIDLAGPFSGMIASDPLFAKRSDFTNKDWYEAFQKAVPFHVEDVKVVSREANVQGTMTTMRVREVVFAKGEAPAPAKADKK